MVVFDPDLVTIGESKLVRIAEITLKYEVDALKARDPWAISSRIPPGEPVEIFPLNVVPKRAILPPLRPALSKLQVFLRPKR